MTTRNQPPAYGHDEMYAQVEAWFAAVEAKRAGEPERAIRLLVPLADDSTTYAMLVANVALGACLVAYHLAELNGQEPGQRPHDGEWVVEAIDPRREGTAVERMCALAVTTAANGEPERAIQQVQTFAHPSERGIERLSSALVHILRLLTAVTHPEVAA